MIPKIYNEEKRKKKWLKEKKVLKMKKKDEGEKEKAWVILKKDKRR